MNGTRFFLGIRVSFVFKSNLLALISPGTYPNYHNSVLPIIFRYCLNPRQNQLAQVFWRIADMMMAGFELLNSGRVSFVQCLPIDRHSCSNFHIRCSIISKSLAIILKASTMSLRMSAIGSLLSTILPFLTKATRLAYVIPSATSAAHYITISFHRITLSARLLVHRATLPAFCGGSTYGLPGVPHIARSCQIEQLC